MEGNRMKTYYYVYEIYNRINGKDVLFGTVHSKQRAKDFSAIFGNNKGFKRVKKYLDVKKVEMDFSPIGQLGL